jgi:small basic protein
MNKHVESRLSESPTAQTFLPALLQHIFMAVALAWLGFRLGLLGASVWLK